MKVVYISTFPAKGKKHIEKGGVASYSKNLIGNIVHPKSDSLIVLANKEDVKKKYRINDIDIIPSFHRDWRYIIEIPKHLIRIKPDIVHIQHEIALFGEIMTFWLFPFVLLIIKLISNNVVVTVHGVINTNKINRTFIKQNSIHVPKLLRIFVHSKFVRFIISLFYFSVGKIASKIVVHEVVFKTLLETHYNIKSDKIEVIPHGIESVSILPKDDARNMLDIQKNTQMCLFIGYITGYKNIDVLIDGFALFTKKNPHAFLIIGAGMNPNKKNDSHYRNQYHAYQRKAEENIPSNQYRWVGFVKEEQIPVYFSAADVVLFPYNQALSASGPMAFALSYNVPFLMSEPFRSIYRTNANIFFNNTKYGLEKILTDFFNNSPSFEFYTQFKKKRDWKDVTKRMYEVYTKLS